MSQVHDLLKKSEDVIFFIILINYLLATIFTTEHQRFV